MKFLSTPIYAGSIALLLSHLVSVVQGQAQEGNISPDGPEDTSRIHNGYFSYVADMDSADSVRQAMETLSWASVGSSWMVHATEQVSSEAQGQATPSSPSQAGVGALATEAASPKAEPESTPAPAVVAEFPSSSSSSSSSNKTLAIGLGVGIPLALLAILSVAGVVIYKKRQVTRKDFDRRTANLRNMTQADV